MTSTDEWVRAKYFRISWRTVELLASLGDRGARMCLASGDPQTDKVVSHWGALGLCVCRP